MTCQRAGVWSFVGLPRDLPSEGFDYARSAALITDVDDRDKDDTRAKTGQKRVNHTRAARNEPTRADLTPPITPPARIHRPKSPPNSIKSVLGHP
jgi:hypothetical protein